MKHYLLSLLLLLASVSAVANPEFVGMLTTRDSGTLFVVLLEPGGRPQWAQLGGTVGEYLLSEYRKGDTLVLRKDGHDFVLQLRTSKVQSSQYSDYVGQPLPLESARDLIASSSGWESDVSYRVLRANDGNWCLTASKKEGRRIAFRFVNLTVESIPMGYGKLELGESKPFPVD